MPKNDTIFKRLEQATEIERKAICEILKLDNNNSNNIEKISAEFRSVSGHTVANIFREPHSYEYLNILKDTWNGVKNSNHFNPKIDLRQEMSLENRLEIVFDSILKNTNIEEFRKEITSLGSSYTVKDVIVGPAGIAGLATKLISLPVTIATTAVGTVTAPSYKKSFLVVVKLIEIKRRLKAEEKLKDEN